MGKLGKRFAGTKSINLDTYLGFDPEPMYKEQRVERQILSEYVFWDAEAMNSQLHEEVDEAKRKPW